MTDKRLERLAVDGADYTLVSVEGDALSGILDGNKRIILYYSAGTEIEDPDTPLDPRPENPAPTPAPGEETDVPAEDVPLAPLPGSVPQTGESAAFSLYLGAALLAAAGLMLLLGLGRKKKKHN